MMARIPSCSTYHAFASKALDNRWWDWRLREFGPKNLRVTVGDWAHVNIEVLDAPSVRAVFRVEGLCLNNRADEKETNPKGLDVLGLCMDRI
jgi:hypothetical protein